MPSGRLPGDATGRHTPGLTHPAAGPPRSTANRTRDMSAFIQYTFQGLAAGGFYALSALGLAVIFGVLGVVNFSHGACYMLGAVISAVLLGELHAGFWVALVVVPVLMFGFGVLMERLLVRWLLALDPLYNFLLTFGLTLILVEAVKQRYGVSGLPYEVPAGLGGQVSVG